jgi:hypothetical protein
LLLFASEEHVDRWCTHRQIEKGAVVPLGNLWRLTGPWYADRLDSGWKPKSAADTERLLTAAGLTGSFWRVSDPPRG